MRSAPHAPWTIVLAHDEGEYVAYRPVQDIAQCEQVGCYASGVAGWVAVEVVNPAPASWRPASVAQDERQEFCGEHATEMMAEGRVVYTTNERI